MHSDTPDGFHAQQTPLGGGALKLSFHPGATTAPPLTWRQVIDLWQHSDAFCTVFSETLATAPIEAFFWETPPLHDGALEHPFACVLTPSPALARQHANPQPFAAYISAEDAPDIVRFANMRGDADLVVPRDTGHGADHAHLAAFLRTADAAQTRNLWQKVSETCVQWRTKGKPFWVSTSGLGVAWLHVRIDTTPKYYAHIPYKAAP